MLSIPGKLGCLAVQSRRCLIQGMLIKGKTVDLLVSIRKELVTTRRKTVIILPLHLGFPGLSIPGKLGCPFKKLLDS